MASELSPETESFIRQQVALGIYQDRADVLEDGIALLRDRERLRARIIESRRQLDAGEYVEFDDDGLCQFFEGLKEQVRSRSEAQ